MSKMDGLRGTKVPSLSRLRQTGEGLTIEGD